MSDEITNQPSQADEEKHEHHWKPISKNPDGSVHHACDCGAVSNH